MSELEYTEQGWRMTTDINRHHRDNHWDYKGRGVYHITLVVADRYPLFGQLEGDSPDSAFIALNDFGKAVSRILHDLPVFYRRKGIALKVLAIQIMPDHIHYALQVLEPMPRSVGEIVRSLKSACTSLYKNNYTVSDGKNTVKENNPVGKSVVTDPPQAVVAFARIFTSRGSIWHPIQAGYHERLLKYRGQLDAMIRYIKDNPRRLWLKRHNPDLFRIHQRTPISGIPCTTLGNMFLYENPFKASLHCSRDLTQTEIDTLKQDCLSLAAHGIIFVSPAVSEGEKQTCRALREAGYPLIILLNEGFPAPDSPHYKYYKPSGVYFEACAAGNLLLIEPSAELFDLPDIETKVFAKTGPIPHTAKRYRFLALNALADKIGLNILA